MIKPVDKKRNQYIEQAARDLVFKSRPNVIFALVPTTKGDDTYAVGIANSKAQWCECVGNCEFGRHCKHMKAVDRRIEMDRIEAQEYDVVAEAHAIVTLGFEVGDAYEQVAQDFAYGCCGHIVKREHEGELCGACSC